MLPEFHAHELTAPVATVLGATTATIAILHTLSGPDHYIPFVAMSRARGWTMRRTLGWTILCGLGHVGSSMVLALAGVFLGFGLKRVQVIEEFRGNVAAWALIAFGAVYLTWGLKRAWRGHVHAPAQEASGRQGDITPWVVFTIFVFGPCEPMIPLVMYPATEGNLQDVWLVTGLFGALTIAAMVGVVWLGVKGLAFAPALRLERYSHAMAGGSVMAAGCAIQFLGL